MGAGEPGLLDMPLGLLADWDGPEGRHEGSTVLVDRNSVQAKLDMVAEACAVKAKLPKGVVPGEIREADTGRDSIGTYGIPYGHAFDDAGTMECLVGRDGIVICLRLRS